VSKRNTGLFLPGHHTPEAIAEAFWSAPGLPTEHFIGAEVPRLGHGTRDGRPYTHFALRLFEVAGLRLMDDHPLPGPDDLELHLGCVLSKLAGQATYLFYDEENAAGGAARFADGALVGRVCFDARDTQPVRRDEQGETPLVGLNPSDWIWKPASEAIEAAAAPLVGPGVRDDDDIAALIEAAGATPIPPPPPRKVSSESSPDPSKRRRDRLRSRVRGWLRK
jgi:hypothetical protein